MLARGQRGSFVGAVEEWPSGEAEGGGGGGNGGGMLTRNG